MQSIMLIRTCLACVWYVLSIVLCVGCLKWKIKICTCIGVCVHQSILSFLQAHVSYVRKPITWWTNFFPCGFNASYFVQCSDSLVFSINLYYICIKRYRILLADGGGIDIYLLSCAIFFFIATMPQTEELM